MGCYLSKPVTEKVSSDDCDDRMNYGASSMQGWRESQEDAHNCILDYDHNTSFFAVYDGHGGHEVSEYCSEMLPKFIQNTEAYKKNDITNALIDGFLGFDATLTTKEVIDVMKEIAGDKEAEEESVDEENVGDLYKEATMPIEEVIEKYTNLVSPALKNLKKDSDKLAKSPCLKSKKISEEEAGSSSSGSSSDCVSSTSGENSAAKEENEASAEKEETETAPKDTEDKKSELNGPLSDKVTSSVTPTAASSSTVEVAQNGESKANTEEATPQENGDISKKGKGKAPPRVSTRPKRNASQLYKKLLDFPQDSEEDSEDEEDKTFEGPNDESSDDDDGVNTAIEVDGSEEDASSEAEEEEEDDDDEIDGVEEEEEEDEEQMEFARTMALGPGSDSGCTAVVAVVRGNEVYVANAGDSRCVICRNGTAVDMSIDHKPEDEPERNRIVKAGGKVSNYGRVNGGLNLSRAIGDHAYKQNKELSDKEQMITALPDVKTLTINPAEDEFMVLACDGIWNFMSSQEVVDFVRPRLKENTKLSEICEEMFDRCLAPNTMGDGTGCDNMTAIIVTFKSNILKRLASPERTIDSGNTSKKAKTENVTASETGSD